MKQNKFTLVELMVVLAIIGILASLLFPTLRKARRSAKTLQCVSQMKQVHAAATMWSLDNDKYHIYTYEGNAVWISRLMKYTGYEDLPDSHLFKCPEVTLPDSNLNWKKTKYAMSLYAGNSDKTHSWYQKVKTAYVSEPVKALMMMESSTYHFRSDIFGDSTSKWGKHDGKTNALFVDGHTKPNIRDKAQIIDPNDTSYWFRWSWGKGK